MNMKNIFNNILLVIGAMLMMTGCEYLDKEPDNIRIFDMIWETRADAEAYLYNVYGYIWVAADDYTVLGVADESSLPLGGLTARRMIEGNWSPSNPTWDYWGPCYQGIKH